MLPLWLILFVHLQLTANGYSSCKAWSTKRLVPLSVLWPITKNPTFSSSPKSFPNKLSKTRHWNSQEISGIRPGKIPQDENLSSSGSLKVWKGVSSKEKSQLLETETESIESIPSPKCWFLPKNRRGTKRKAAQKNRDLLSDSENAWSISSHNFTPFQLILWPMILEVVDLQNVHIPKATFTHRTNWKVTLWEPQTLRPLRPWSECLDLRCRDSRDVNVFLSLSGDDGYNMW